MFFFDDWRRERRGYEGFGKKRDVIGVLRGERFLVISGEKEEEVDWRVRVRIDGE